MITRAEREYPKRPIASVAACVFKEGKILLVQRGTQPSKGKWSVPGGAIELGESFSDTAKRELDEECGVEIEVGDIFGVENFLIRDEDDNIQYHYIVTYLTAKYVSGDIRPGSEELDVCWATREELMNLDMNPITRDYMFKAFETVDSISKEIDTSDKIK
ncbi:MAG: NUDIX hydrolase [Dehalococcoidales bacterium]|nr:MAG: NUDIX hydrolase [Dehalococcoidales bacterium]